MRALVVLLMTTIPASAEFVPLRYQSVEVTPASVWKDELRQAVRPRIEEAHEGRFIVSILDDPLWCSVNECEAMVFDTGLQAFRGEVCTNTEFHAIDVERRIFRACGEEFSIDPVHPDF